MHIHTHKIVFAMPRKKLPAIQPFNSEGQSLNESYLDVITIMFGICSVCATVLKIYTVVTGMESHLKLVEEEHCESVTFNALCVNTGEIPGHMQPTWTFLDTGHLTTMRLYIELEEMGCQGICRTVGRGYRK